MAEYSIDDMVVAYEAGNSLGSIGRVFGISASVVRKALVSRGVTIRQCGKPRRNEARDAEIERRFRSGFHQRTIAQSFDISAVRVHKILKKRGCLPHLSGGEDA